MRLVKRLLVWLAEITSQALLLSLLLLFMLGHDKGSFARELLGLALVILWFFFLAGYAVTTGAARALWRGKTSWRYPLLGTLLFIAHFEVFNISMGGIYTPSERRIILIVGIVVAFVTTCAGTLFLRKSSGTAAQERLTPE
jgi:hypothetical protein